MLSGAQGREQVAEAVALLDLDIENLRAIITELRPAALDELGLAAALAALVDRVRGQTGIAIEAQVQLGGQPLPGQLDMAAYRLVQEALTNIVRHAGAQRAQVVVRRDADSLEIRVEDDGEGFDPEGRPRGFGLVGMRERAELEGGSLEVASSASGTVIAARLPLQQPTPVQRFP
jgi:signal transduction histidine kinase